MAAFDPVHLGMLKWQKGFCPYLSSTRFFFVPALQCTAQLRCAAVTMVSSSVMRCWLLLRQHDFRQIVRLCESTPPDRRYTVETVGAIFQAEFGGVSGVFSLMGADSWSRDYDLARLGTAAFDDQSHSRHTSLISSCAQITYPNPLIGQLLTWRRLKRVSAGCTQASPERSLSAMR